MWVLTVAKMWKKWLLHTIKLFWDEKAGITQSL